MRQPDPRLVERLCARLRESAAPSVFVVSGDALARGLLDAGGEVRPWAEPLADTMLGALLRLVDRTTDSADAVERIRLAEAATVLSVARPHAAWGCDAASTLWLGWGGRREPEVDDLASEVLLALLIDDVDRAVQAVHELGAYPEGVGLVLHDWVVARVQDHGPLREAQCFANLCVAVRDSWAERPALLVVGSVVAADRRRWRRIDARRHLAQAMASVSPIPAMRTARR